MDQKQLLDLLNAYSSGNCTPEESQALMDWFDSVTPEDQAFLLAEDKKGILTEIMLSDFRQRFPSKKKGTIIWLGVMQKWTAAAAVLLCLVGIGYYVFFSKKERPNHSVVQDVNPGGNHATLTLANGQKIILDSAGIGQLTAQNGVQVIKLDSGQVAYQSEGDGSVAAAYNTLSTPRGGQYQIILPDGSKVWLNAASSLRFPIAFGRNIRQVELSGEAYFEVAHNAARPFHVKAGAIEVEVLGTHFDLQAYQDEPNRKTTLYQGKVRIFGSGRSVTLHPLQQAISAGTATQVIVPEDIEDIIAWKNGLISFNGVDIPTLMRQLSRWYDMQVKYKGKIPQKSMVGDISRYMKLSKVLEVLELNGIHCRIEEKILVVKGS